MIFSMRRWLYIVLGVILGIAVLYQPSRQNEPCGSCGHDISTGHSIRRLSIGVISPYHSQSGFWVQTPV